MTSQSWEEIPHGVITLEPEATKFLEVAKALNANATPDTKITLNTVVMRVIVEALKACPALNAHLDFNRKLVRGTYTQFEEINISMPMILNNGEMMTVNLHNMHNKNLHEMQSTVKDASRRANNSDMNEVMFEVSLNDTIHGLLKGKIKQTICRLFGSKMPGKHQVKTLKGSKKKEYYSIPENDRLTKYDIEQGTITISNLGSTYRSWKGVCTILEIIPPQVCAIAIGSAQLVPIAEADGTIRTGYKLPLTIAFDHRALDMGDITPFMQKIDEIFAHPEVMLQWA